MPLHEVDFDWYVYGTRVVLSLMLLVAPGSFIVYSPIGRVFSPIMRLIACIAFSPFVLSVETVASALIGLPFNAFTLYVVPINAAGMILILKALPRVWLQLQPSKAVGPALIAFVCFILPLIIVWVSVPHLRVYGWHHMMQMASINQIYELPKLPEEADLAGFRLNYGWLGFAQIAILSSLLDRPATVFFIGINVAQLTCMFAFLVATVRRFSSASLWLTSIATAFSLLTTSLTRVPLWYAAGGRLPGENRLIAVISKFLFIDAMNYGLACFAMLVYTCAMTLTSKASSPVWLIPLAALACMIAYPLFIPSCALLIAVLSGFMIFSLARSQPCSARYPTKSVRILVGGSVIVFGVAGLYLAVIGKSATEFPIHPLDVHILLVHLVSLLLGFVPPFVALVPAALLWRRAGSARQTIAPLALAGGLLVLSYTVLQMGLRVEYKFLFTGLWVLVPVAAWGIAETVGTIRLRFAALTVLLGAAVIAEIYGFWAQLPPNLSAASTLDEATPAIHPVEGWGRSWMRAVRDLTPKDTVLIAEDTGQAVPVFTGRAVYVVDGDNQRAGYTMSSQEILVEVKGYSPSAIEERKSVQRLCFAAAADERELQSALNALARLGRPIALRFSTEAAMLKRLERTGLGRPVFRGEGETIWLILPYQMEAAILQKNAGT